MSTVLRGSERDTEKPTSRTTARAVPPRGELPERRDGRIAREALLQSGVHERCSPGCVEDELRTCTNSWIVQFRRKLSINTRHSVMMAL